MASIAIAMFAGPSEGGTKRAVPPPPEAKLGAEVCGGLAGFGGAPDPPFTADVCCFFCFQLGAALFDGLEAC